MYNCLGKYAPEMHQHVARMLSEQATNNIIPIWELCLGKRWMATFKVVYGNDQGGCPQRSGVDCITGCQRQRAAGMSIDRLLLLTLIRLGSNLAVHAGQLTRLVCCRCHGVLSRPGYIPVQSLRPRAITVCTVYHILG